MALKTDVKTYWEAKVCGTTYGRNRADESVDLERMAETRYRLEPYIPPFADFPSARGKRMLEIGVGGGVDFSNWVKNGADATGVDLTEAGIKMARARLESMPRAVGKAGGKYRLLVADGENLAFPDATFDFVYSWGVLHHSPDTAKAFSEVSRVLKPGGTFKGMVYHARSMVNYMLWLRWGLMSGKLISVRRAVFENLESPGTKVYSVDEIRTLLATVGFKDIHALSHLSFGDLLMNKPSTRYQSPLYRIVWKLYPRWFIRLLGHRFGGNLMFVATR
ncbi:MAG TPA: class I SAM-dependent methyltransferase [Phycisphaerae bacterium]|nr:class I SAM-dependent methyltransferase [Phycisphaerae bacterium]